MGVSNPKWLYLCQWLYFVCGTHPIITHSAEIIFYGNSPKGLAKHLPVSSPSIWCYTRFGLRKGSMGFLVIEHVCHWDGVNNFPLRIPTQIVRKGFYSYYRVRYITIFCIFLWFCFVLIDIKTMDKTQVLKRIKIAKFRMKFRNTVILNRHS